VSDELNRLHIREAGLSDISLLSELIRLSYRDVAEKFRLTPANCPKHPSNYTDEWVEKDLGRGVSYYILEHRGAAAGCVAIEKANPDLCYLERLAVLPHKRNKGFGSQLVKHVIRTVRKLGSKNISIGIIARQTELKQWYQEIGFIEGETKEFSHQPFKVIFMTYAL
jgi:N-acetylglutamate synthase-like GNAT family acetyltransferase